jgi:hypothetical protein
MLTGARWVTAVGISLLLSVAGATLPVAGQADNDAFPRVSGGAPPDWVKPGLRLSWYGEAASVQTSYYTYVEDENGDWEDPITHKRYRQTDEDEMPTAAGRAFTQSDVIAVDGDDVIMDTTMFNIDIETGHVSLTPLWGGRYAGAAVDGAWVRPDLLATVASGGTTDLQVLRGPYKLWDRDVDSVAFLNRGEGSYASTVFDSTTGALVASTARVKGAGSPVHGPVDLPEGNVLIAWTRLAGVRQREAPGLGDALPDWVHRGLVLRYSGTVTIANPYDTSGSTFNYPVDVTVTLDDAGANWAAYSSSTAVDYGGGHVDTSQAIGATGAVGQYWYVPSGLAHLAAGDVLDEDPLTGARQTVDAVGSGVVTVRTKLSGATVVASYDAVSGAMTKLTLEQGVGTTQLQLASIS